MGHLLRSQAYPYPIFAILTASTGSQFLGDRPHLLQRAAAGRFRCRHHRALDNGRVAHDNHLPPLRLQHLHRHLAVGLGAAEIDQDRDALRRPGVVDRLHDQPDIGAEPAIGIAAAEGDLHFAADHLPHHVGGALGDVLGVGDDDDADRVIHCRASSVLQTACTKTQLDFAPGSTWPMLRAPRNEARPLVACIGTVRSTASAAVARTRSIRSGRPASAFKVSSTGTSTSSMVFSPAWERPRALTASTPLPNTSARSSGSVLPAIASPAARKNEP